MSDRYVRETGCVVDMDGLHLIVGVDYDTVTIGHRHGKSWQFTQAQLAWLMEELLTAAWQAAQQQQTMAQESTP